MTGKVIAKAAGASSTDIPWLKLEATPKGGAGELAGIATVLRINTKGGVASKTCDQGGAFLSVPYSADYVFLKK